ncbi:hypothetical protein PVK06_040510 [Gossypium arboreum]|uniref:Uncharacterized protein n=1 Tax=Gossypium arboreum TaxID=29729 RepID=A0ABR0N5Q4_GOSAR|nr:hypothetical protein PVK06_040510 [Gossypium arboreum]
MRIQERLTLAEKDIVKLHGEITVKSHKEALEKYKSDTIQNFQDYLPDLKSNFLLHTQVVGDPFNACRVNFDVLDQLIGAQLDFNVHFPFRVAWEEFVEE